MRIFLLFSFIVLSLASCDKENFRTDFKVIAHRGYWEVANGAENSIMSLQEAGRVGVDGVELDVCKTKDDSLVVVHGPYYGGFYIPETTYNELKKQKLSNGENIPTFSEYIKEAVKYNMFCLIDLKSAGIESKVLRIIAQYNCLHKVKFVSSISKICESLIGINPNLYVAYSSGNKSPEELKKLGYSGIHYNISVWKKHTEWIDEAKSLGLDIAAWVVSTESDIIWCSSHKIGNLVTDTPLEVLHFKSNYE